MEEEEPSRKSLQDGDQVDAESDQPKTVQMQGISPDTGKNDPPRKERKGFRPRGTAADTLGDLASHLEPSKKPRRDAARTKNYVDLQRDQGVDKTDGKDGGNVQQEQQQDLS